MRMLFFNCIPIASSSREYLGGISATLGESPLVTLVGHLSNRIKTTGTNAIFNHILSTVVYKSAAQKTVFSLVLIGSGIGIIVFGYIIYRRQVLPTEWEVLLGA